MVEVFKLFIVILAFGLSSCGTGESRVPREGSGEIKYLEHNGLKRSYILYVPKTIDLSGSVVACETAVDVKQAPKVYPLLIALHGGFGLGENMRKLSCGRFDELAEEKKFIVVYPDGIERHWNDGRSKVSYRSHKTKVDDVGFLSALIDNLVSDFSCDKRRVYVTGMSNGAIMSFRLAIELSHKVAAIAPVAGGMVPEQLYMKALGAQRAVPVMIVQNTQDPMVPIDGGEIGVSGKRIGKVLPLKEAMTYWIKRNGCNQEPSSVQLMPDTEPEDRTRTTCSVYSGGSAPLVVLSVDGGGHTWPGGYQYLNELLIGVTSRDFDCSDVVWEFFRRQKL